MKYGQWNMCRRFRYGVILKNGKNQLKVIETLTNKWILKNIREQIGLLKVIKEKITKLERSRLFTEMHSSINEIKEWYNAENYNI